MVQNWKQTELGKDFDIFEEDGELVGQQYQSDTGPMDILAIKKDKSQLLVVELKKGRASDAVVGQVLRYMGYVKQELAEPNQSVKGVIIALDDDTFNNLIGLSKLLLDVAHVAKHLPYYCIACPTLFQLHN